MALPDFGDLGNALLAPHRLFMPKPPEAPDINVDIPPAQQPPTIDQARKREELSRRLRRRQGQRATIKSSPGGREPSAAARVLLGQG